MMDKPSSVERTSTAKDILMDENLSAALREIISFLNPSKVILFGSRARGTHRSDSDYDIFILLEQRSARDMEIRGHLLDKGILFNADYVFGTDLDDIRPLLREISKEGVCLYNKSS